MQNINYMLCGGPADGKWIAAYENTDTYVVDIVIQNVQQVRNINDFVREQDFVTQHCIYRKPHPTARVMLLDETT